MKLIKLVVAFVLVFSSCNGISQEKKSGKAVDTEKNESFEVTKTEDEWREELTDMQFYILRKAGTEIAGTSELLNNKAEGIYVCAGCDTPVFRSEHKFKSGTGWPSFDREIKGNVAFDVDYIAGYKRIEEHCATCGGHLGHVFDDGPSHTTGKRHCINGAALQFIPAE